MQYEEVLGILAKHSITSIPKYRADISVILYVAHDMLLSLIPDVRSLFHPNPAHVASRSIHQKCLTLLLAQVMMGPIKNFERYIEALNNPDEEEHRMPKRLEPIKKVIVYINIISVVEF